MDTGALQYLHFPRIAIHPTIGRFSLKKRSLCLQDGQQLGGVNMRMFRGSRYTNTFKKLPTQLPSTNTNIAAGKCSRMVALSNSWSIVEVVTMSKVRDSFPSYYLF
jgi:hypothetical protein